jgi:hypothetical protein
MDPDSDPGGPNTRGSGSGLGSATLQSLCTVHHISTFCRLSSGAPRRRRSNLALRGAPTSRLREGAASRRPSGELTMAPATLFLPDTAMFLIFWVFWLKVERALIFSLHNVCKRKNSFDPTTNFLLISVCMFEYALCNTLSFSRFSI